MTNKLVNLIQQLQLNVPPSSGNPADAQYSSAVIEAVADFGRRCPSTRVVTINVQANVSDYDLPNDFVRVSQFPSLRQLAVGTATGAVILTGSGVVPISNTYNERYSIRNKKLTIIPTPLYSIARPLFYAGGFPLEGAAPNQAFTELSDDDAAIAMHKAADLILMQIANGVARQNWSYSLAGESVTKSSLSQAIRDQAKAEREQYEQAIATRANGGGGTLTVQADYNTNEYGSFAGDV